MTQKVAIITAIYDNYDVLRPVVSQAGDFDIEWLCVTDTSDVVTDPQGWAVLLEPRPGVHPNLAAKRPKMLPWNYTDAEVVIWIDASYQILSPLFVRDVLATAHPLAQFVHPDRQCIYDEAAVSQQMVYKYGGHNFPEQIARFRAEGHPPYWGLWATGVIVRYKTQTLIDFGKAWHEECHLYSFQDQVSQPPLLRKFGLRPESLAGGPYQNPWLMFKGSGRH